MRIYILGASCTGTTTLGSALSQHLGLPHVDTDDHYWAPVDPPFSKKLPPEARVASLRLALGDHAWVLSGSCMGWGDEVARLADLFIFLTLDQNTRLVRLKNREKDRFGKRIVEGGDMYQIHQNFVAWAARYEDPEFQGRSRARHLAWLAEQDTPFHTLDSSGSVEKLVRCVVCMSETLACSSAGNSY